MNRIERQLLHYAKTKLREIVLDGGMGAEMPARGAVKIKQTEYGGNYVNAIDLLVL